MIPPDPTTDVLRDEAKTLRNHLLAEEKRVAELTAKLAEAEAVQNDFRDQLLERRRLDKAIDDAGSQVLAYAVFQVNGEYDYRIFADIEDASLFAEEQRESNELDETPAVIPLAAAAEGKKP